MKRSKDEDAEAPIIHDGQEGFLRAITYHSHKENAVLVFCHSIRQDQQIRPGHVSTGVESGRVRV